MALGLLKWLKETCSYEEIYYCKNMNFAWKDSLYQDERKIKKTQWDIFLNTEYHVCWLLKNSPFGFFRDGKYDLFLSQKVDVNMVFNGGKYGIYWLLNFSGIRNNLLLSQKVVGKWYILITEKFLFWNFWWWEIVFFSAKMLMDRWYLLGLF